MNARLIYGLAGVAVGACFPIGVLLLAWLTGGAPPGESVVGFIIASHAAQQLLYIVDSAPFIVGLAAYSAGIRQDATTARTLVLQDEAVQRRLTLQRLAGDIDARKRVEAQLIHQTFHDRLTNLANRALLVNRIEHSIARAGSAKSSIAVLLLDLDDFKTVNDTLGHERGDALLVTIAARFATVARPFDTLARLGGDEFALLVERVGGLHEAVAFGQRLIDAMDVPLKLGDQYVRMSASVGVAFGDRNATALTLLRDADLAMYDAKTRGKGCLRVFRPELQSALLKRVELGGDFQRALRDKEFYLLYQPIVELTDGRIVGMEALVRWRHPRRGIVSPIEFIGIAEETNAIVDLGRWILHAACHQMAAWQHLRADGRSLTLTVNVSPLQLQQPRFLADVEAALGAAGLAADQLVLEITESALVDDSAETLAVFVALKAIGIRLAIDDFGTGYSSLSYLRRFPFDILKIDKAFVDGVAGGGSDAAFARTIIALGAMLELRVLAEGIEHQTQLATLRELGCEFGQGYLFARPLDVEAMTILLEARAAPRAIRVPA